MSQFYDDDDTEHILQEITDELSSQVKELDPSENEALEDHGTENSKRHRAADLSGAWKESRNGLDDMEEAESAGGGRKKKSLGTKILIGICCVFFAMILTVVGMGAHFLSRIQQEEPVDVEAGVLSGEKEKPMETADPNAVLPADAEVINILLIGEEALKDKGRGRSDSIMIATLNQKQKSVKLTSVLRDCYVTIPGYRDNKLNAAYNEGGAPLLVETVEQNFGIPLDGYVRVNFDGFEAIVDKLGGVEIELTEAEARYLNTHDYISKPEYRNVRAGLQTLNGNQALGYSRVRYVKGIDGESNDFGRTNRQRIVLNAIFEKYKTKNLLEYISLVDELTQYLKTDLSTTDILSYFAAFVMMGTPKLETFRVPTNDGYTDGDVPGPGKVLLVNFEINQAALREFIYGTKGVANAGGE